MAGLDSIRKFATGGTTTTSPLSAEPAAEVVDEKVATQAPLTSKAVASKNDPYSLGTPTGLVGVDPDLLANMQRLIEEREAQKGGFMENLKDATAWWSGGMAGPSEALGRRAKEREEFNATTFGMKRDLAQNKMAAAREANLGAQIFGSPAAQTKAQPGATPAAGATPTATAPGGLIDLVQDPGLKQSITTIAGSRGNEAALTEINKYLAKNAEDPTLAKEIKYLVNNNLIDKNLLPAAVLTKFVGSGALVPHTINTPGGKMQGTPLGAASGMSPSVGAGTGNVPSAATTTPTTNAVVNPSVPTGNPPVSTGATTAPTTTATAAKPVLPHTQPLAKIPPPSQTPITTSDVPEAAPLVSPNVKTGFTPGSDEDLAAKAEIAKQNIALNTEQRKPIEKGAGESAVALTNAAGKAKDNIQQYDMAEAILRKYPKAFGISQDGSVTAMLAQLAGPGTTIPIVGTLKAPGFEEAIAQKRLGPKELAARSAFDTLASRFATDYANQNLTGEGRGTLSNADMKMAGVAKGLNKEAPAAANLIFAVLNRENEQMQLERGQAWEKYQKDMRANGYQPDFNRFRESDAYKKAMADKEARIARRFPEFFEKGTEAPKEKAHPGEALVDKYRTKKD